MCEVCAANLALKSAWAVFKSAGVEVRAISQSAEFSPAYYQYRRRNLNGSYRYSKILRTKDLASSLRWLAFKNEPTPKEATF